MSELLLAAHKLYTNLGYSVYRRILNYYGSGGKGADEEDAYDMRKSMSRDVKKETTIPLERPVTADEIEWHQKKIKTIYLFRMTRYARFKGNSHRQEFEATNWEDMKDITKKKEERDPSKVERSEKRRLKRQEDKKCMF